MSTHSIPELTQVWADAVLAARLLTAPLRPDGPRVCGVHLRARPGPVLSAWLETLRDLAGDVPFLRFSATMDPARLCDGVDLAASIAARRPVVSTGLLGRAQGGLLVIGMAERLDPPACAAIAAAIDRGEPVRFVALDEGAEPDETLPDVLSDRLQLRLDLGSVPHAQTGVRPVRDDAPPADAPAVGDAMLTLFAEVGIAAGSRSLRLPLALAGVSSAIAALDRAAEISQSHAAAAIRLTLGLSGVEAPQQIDEPQEQPQPPPQDDVPPQGDAGSEQQAEPDAATEMLVAIQQATLPLAVFFRHDGARGGPRGQAGKAGRLANDGARGRSAGHSTRPTAAAPRPDPVATLRVAAPWQKLRGRRADGALSVRKDDFRYRRCKQPSQSTTIFAVDASGSTALDRLGEAKGAVELLLAESYVRRDQVALLAFRGGEAQLLLEPTRSLVRAKRQLGGLPGGGATPLASAILKSMELAKGESRKGHSPLVVLMTDGSANVTLTGDRNREAAMKDAQDAAARFAASGFDAVVVDIARRDRPEVRDLARRMGADYCRLPRTDAAGVSKAVSARLHAR